MATFDVVVRQFVRVTIDETKFTPEFLEEFRRDFYDFDTLEQHAEHLGQLKARGLIDGLGDQFVEGYGPLAAAGVNLAEYDGLETEVEEPRR